jgi:hypothetical protein
LRIGPFVHGEARNGGFPDWLYGRPFTLRTNDERYLFYVKRLYNEIGSQVKGLMYKEGGPVIGIQLENEHMHASPPWEFMSANVMEWVGNGSGGADHIRILKELALEAGMDVPIYTCTGWGGASFIEDETLPLYGGYSFQPWQIIYMGESEHGPTNEYLIQSFHDENAKYPYACCELGGGMVCWYEYRFQVPPESVEAATLTRIAGGCNFIGYYMFHDGTNPKGVHGFLNERNVPNLSYNFQAPIGEYGQLRESYRHLKPILYFLKDFEDVLCRMGTVLPEEAARMIPEDNKTLRYAVRQNAGSGFIFLINYQDHFQMKDFNDIKIELKLNDETITIPYKGFRLKRNVSAILPFNLDMDGIRLKYAIAQLITFIEDDGVKTYFFFAPEGMAGSYCFDMSGIANIAVKNAKYAMDNEYLYIDVKPGKDCIIELTTDKCKKVRICTLTRDQSFGFWKCNLWGKDRILLSDSELIVKDDMLELRNIANPCFKLDIFPAVEGVNSSVCDALSTKVEGIFTSFGAKLAERKIDLEVVMNVKAKAEAEVKFPDDMFSDDNEVFLRVDYVGSVGNAFIDGRLVSDDFFNGSIWEIGLKRHLPEVVLKGMYFHIIPYKKGSSVIFDKDIIFRHEFDQDQIAEIYSIEAIPQYKLQLQTIGMQEQFIECSRKLNGGT